MMMNFNPRTPCGVRHQIRAGYIKVSEFQSTHPMRGATSSAALTCLTLPYFNPRTPCGVRHAVNEQVRRVVQISIHAPHAGCDNDDS